MARPGGMAPASLQRCAALALAAVAVVVLAVGGLALRARHRRAVALEEARVAWSRVQLAMLARLKQKPPLEYGAVWITHTGLTCGLVNGWGSFGGLAGMTPFYVWRGAPVFGAAVSTDDFAEGWRECLFDQWAFLRPGPIQGGWCATRQGAKTCKREETD